MKIKTKSFQYDKICYVFESPTQSILSDIITIFTFSFIIIVYLIFLLINHIYFKSNIIIDFVLCGFFVFFIVCTVLNSDADNEIFDNKEAFIKSIEKEIRMLEKVRNK